MCTCNITFAPVDLLEESLKWLEEKIMSGMKKENDLGYK
jgi:hypothetical protein